MVRFFSPGKGQAAAPPPVPEGQRDAAAALQLAIDSGHAAAAPTAALNLGVLRAGHGDTAGATAAFQLAIDSGHADIAPLAREQLGHL